MAASSPLRAEPVPAPQPIAFVDLAAQRARIRRELDAAVARVMDAGAFILGPEVDQLERMLEAFSGAAHCVTCANGTDAIVLVLMAEGIGPGDAVLVPSFTFMATAEAVSLRGATPIFLDVERTSFNLDPAAIAKGVAKARARGLRPRLLIAVDLFGQPADYAAIAAEADRHGLMLVADAAQSFGAALGGRKVGTLAAYTTTSFFPAKPLGCYGDGGAILTMDKAKADLLRSLRFHGKGKEKYDNVRVGLNSRLDTLQAAILIEKVKIFASEIEARERVAQRYHAGLANHVVTPSVAAGATTVWAQYTLVLPAGRSREAFQEACKAAGVPTAVYYPTPLHKQTAYRDCPQAEGGCPVSEDLAARVVSLPMHPYLDAATQDHIIATVIGALR